MYSFIKLLRNSSETIVDVVRNILLRPPDEILLVTPPPPTPVPPCTKSGLEVYYFSNTAVIITLLKCNYKSGKSE